MAATRQKHEVLASNPVDRFQCDNLVRFVVKLRHRTLFATLAAGTVFKQAATAKLIALNQLFALLDDFRYPILQASVRTDWLA